MAARAPTFDDNGALAPSTGWTPPGMGAARRPNGDEAPAIIGALEPANATQVRATRGWGGGLQGYVAAK